MLGRLASSNGREWFGEGCDEGVGNWKKGGKEKGVERDVSIVVTVLRISGVCMKSCNYDP